MAENADYSLSTEIKMDFSDAMDGASGFAENIEAAEGQLRSLSEAVKKVKLNVANIVDEELKKVDPKKMRATEIDLGSKLKVKLEQAIANSLLGKDLILNGNFKSLDVTLTGAQQKDLMRGVREGLIKNLDFKDFILPKISLSRDQRNEIEKKFNEFINRSIQKNVKFEWGEALDINPDVSSKEELKKQLAKSKPTLHLKITEEHLQTLLQAVEDSFNATLEKFVKIEIPEMPPIKVDSKKLVSLMTNIREKIGNIDNFISGDDKVLAEIPNIDTTMTKFRENLRTIASEIIKINSDLNKLQVDKSAGDAKKIAEAITSLKANTLAKMLEVVTEVESAILATPKGTLKVGEYNSAIKNIAAFVDNYILSTLEKAQKAIVAPMKEAMMNSEAVIKAQSEIATSLHNVVEQTKTTVGEPINLDLSGLVKLATEKVEQSVQASVERFVGIALTPSGTEATAPKKRGRPRKNPEVTQQQADLGEFSISPSELRTNVITPVKNGFVAMLNKAGVQVVTELNTLSGEQLLEGVNFKKVTGEVDKALNSYLKGYITKISASLASTESAPYEVSFSSLHPAVRKALAKEANMSVSEYKAAHPVLMQEEGGDDLMNKIMKENMTAVIKKFHEALEKNTVQAIKEYHEALGNVEIQPNIEAVHELTRRMTNLQDEIVKKIKSILNEQFKYMTDEIRGMKLMPISLGYTPSATAEKKLVSAANTGTKKSVSAQTSSEDVMPVSMSVPTASGVKSGYRLSPGGDTRSFSGAILNTLRYTLANNLWMLPYTAATDAWDSAKSFDYDLTKAQQNFVAKDNMKEAAETRAKLRNQQKDTLGEYGISDEEYSNNKDKYVAEEQKRLAYMAKEGSVKPLQNMAFTYAISQENMGKIWQIASRRLDDPYEALALSQAAGKIYASEPDEISPEDSAKGLESIASQWGFNGYQLDKVSNMVVKTAQLNQSSSKDILDAMGKSGGVWRNVLPQKEGETEDAWKQRAFATGAAMQSLFVQATAASGKDAGTFWKSILMSPYQKEVAQYLHDYSKTPGYEKLDPFVTTQLGNGKEDSRSKSGYDMFLDVIDAAQTMRSRGQEKEAMDMMTKVFKKFQIGSAMNIASLMGDMDSLTEEEKKNGVKSTDALIEKIQQVAETEVNAMIGSLANTWQGKQQRVKTMWETTAFSLVESFKPEAGNAMDTLIDIMRVVRSNADNFANALQFTANVLLAFAAKTAGVKAWGSVKGTVMEEEYAAKVAPLIKSNAELNKQRISYEGKKDKLSTSISDAVARKAELEKDQNIRKAKQESLAHDIAADKTALDEYALNPEADKNEVAKQQKAISEKETSYNALSHEVDLGDKKIEQATNLVDLRKQRYEKYDKESSGTTSKITENENQLNSLKTAYTQLGASSEALDIRTKKLASTMVAGKVASGEYKITINSLGETQIKAGEGTLSLEEATAKLTEEFKAGAITAREYIATLNELNGTSLTPKGTPLSTITRGGLGGIGSKILGGLKGVGSMVALTAAMDVIGDVSTTALKTNGEKESSQVTKEKDTLNLMSNYAQDISNGKGGSAVGKAMALDWNILTNGVGSWFGGSGTSFKESLPMYWKMLKEGKSKEQVESELGIASKETEANAKVGEETKKEQEKYDSTYLHLAGGKHADTTKTSWADVDTAEEGQQMISRVNTELGYKTSTANLNYALKNQALLEQGYRTDSDEVRKITIDMLDTVIEAFDSAASEIKNRMKQIEDALPDTYKDNDAWKEANKSYQELEQQKIAYQQQKLEQQTTAARDKVLNDAQRALTNVESQNTINQAQVSTEGYSQTSDKYLAEVNAGTAKTIAAKQAEINKLQALISNRTFKGQNAEELTAQINQLKAEVANLQVTQHQTITAKVEDIESKHNLQLSNLDASSRMTLDDAVMRGYGEDSEYYKSLERASLSSRNNVIAETIAKLQVQADKLKNDERDKVLNQIAQLQAESRDNLVKIYKSMQSGTTFNIPSGIKPLTYEESLMQGNSEKSVAVTQGNTSITVKIDNVYASTKKEVEDNIARPVVDKIRESINKNTQVTNSLVDQYRRRVGNFRI